MGGASAEKVPTVSVIVPVFNGAWCVRRTLEGVMRQTLGDFEAIVVDDGSKDGSAELVRRLIGADPRFRLIVQENAGVATTRNRALAMARGRYVAPLDADDVWRPSFLEKAVARLEARPRAVMAFARSVWIDAEDNAPPQAQLEAPSEVGYRELLLHNPIGNGSATVIRRDALQAIGGFDAELQCAIGQADDWWTQLQLSWRGEVVFVDEPLVQYRITPNSTSLRTLSRMAAATRAIIRKARAEGPRLAAQDYRDARSLAMLWIARRARHAGRYGLMLRLGLEAYVANPLWFTQPELRRGATGAVAWPLRRVRGPRDDIWRRLLPRDQAGASRLRVRP